MRTGMPDCCIADTIHIGFFRVGFAYEDNQQSQRELYNYKLLHQFWQKAKLNGKE